MLKGHCKDFTLQVQPTHHEDDCSDCIMSAERMPPVIRIIAAWTSKNEIKTVTKWKFERRVAFLNLHSCLLEYVWDVGHSSSAVPIQNPHLTKYSPIAPSALSSRLVRTWSGQAWSMHCIAKQRQESQAWTASCNCYCVSKFHISDKSDPFGFECVICRNTASKQSSQLLQ